MYTTRGPQLTGGKKELQAQIDAVVGYQAPRDPHRWGKAARDGRREKEVSSAHHCACAAPVAGRQDTPHSAEATPATVSKIAGGFEWQTVEVVISSPCARSARCGVLAYNLEARRGPQ